MTAAELSRIDRYVFSQFLERGPPVRAHGGEIPVDGLMPSLGFHGLCSGLWLQLPVAAVEQSVPRHPVLGHFHLG